VPLPGRVRGKHHVLQSRQTVDEVELLEDETERGASDLGKEPLRQARHLTAREGQVAVLPAVGLAMQPIRLASVVFPEPLGPTRPVTSLARTTRLTPSTVV